MARKTNSFSAASGRRRRTLLKCQQGSSPPACVIATPAPASPASRTNSRRPISLFVLFVVFHQSSYGNIAVMFRFGTCPTGIRVTSLIVLMSMTDTELD